MSRPKIAVTNYDKSGRVTDNWHVRIGNTWTVFTPERWKREGIAFIQGKLGSA